MNTLHQAASRLLTAAAAAAVTLCLFAGVVSIAEPDRIQLAAHQAQH